MESPAKEESRRQARKSGAPRRRVLRFESDTAAKYEDIPSSFGKGRRQRSHAARFAHTRSASGWAGIEHGRRRTSRCESASLTSRCLAGWLFVREGTRRGKANGLAEAVIP